MCEYRRRLPHFHHQDAYLFITWRGSLPAQRSFARYPTPGHAFVAQDRLLDRPCSGPLWLQQSQIADLVAQTMLMGEHEREFYKLYACAVMPNHVHFLSAQSSKRSIHEMEQGIDGREG